VGAARASFGKSNMALNLEDLLAPVSADDPVGPDLGYDPDRSAIEQAFEIDVSIDASGVAAQAADTDWRPIIQNIGAQSIKTKDLWLAVYLTRAGALSGSLETVETGALYLAGLLETYWPTVHPQLEEYGFQGRKGPCDSLAAPAQFINPLRNLTLLTHPRLGQFSGADFARFRSGGESEDGYRDFRLALDDLGHEALEEIVAKLDTISSALRRVDQVLTANAESGGGATNFQPTYDALKELREAVQAFGPPPKAEADEVAESGDAAEGVAPSGKRLSGQVDTREDVLRALDAISEYYRRREPGHPILMLLQRAREWVGLDFLAILEDIAPGSISEARTVLQLRSQRDDL
jgi:type VI secretion system protein ImpA